jgi:pyrroline-5-carboxylate reductase
MNKIAVLGCGNLGMSIVRGLLDNSYPAQNIIATKRNTANLDPLKKAGVQISSDNHYAVKVSDIIILAVKPHNVEAVLAEIRDVLDTQQQILVSLATGITVAEIERCLGKSMPIVRAMPNTAADVGESLSCLYAKNCSPKQTDEIKKLFDSIGETLFINEELMEAATILGACGIAYVLRFIRAMIQGGIQVGFDANTATKIVTQTVKGAAELLIQRNEHPEKEIDKVTTPKGCTIVGLNEMEHSGFSSSLIKGIVASYKAIEK